MKPGAIENLHRRLDSLETSIEELKSQPQQQHHGGDVPTISGSSILSLLAQELQRLNDRSNRGLAERHQTPITFNENPYEAPNPSPRKRRRTDGDLPPPTYDASGMPPLPPHSTLEVVIETYFSHVHPWIPMLQKARFHQRLSDSSERPRLLVILQAMMVAAMRYVDVSSVGGLFGKQDIDAARNWVISTAMSSLVIESLQALTIIAFNDIGNGEEMRAWSVIGSLTRTVEYLQLTVESEEVERPPLSKPFMSLSPHEECVWIETEERRRVFWNIFNLDRFCSISMGWNTSLTSNDVHRRLPCDISLWWQDEPVVTPYFNIWDKSAGRIGNPIAFLPSHYGSSGQNNTSSEDDKGTPMESGLSPTGSVPSINMSTVGAFAYSVEATESLSQVTTYFLQQKVNMRDQREIGSWLTRFKELDLRLIHWKMFLPQKWKADMARQSIRMDPNLTLAHITHNTSIILLHQPIAFPPIAWSFSARLPSSSSAETCHTAAVEVSSITRNYLKTVPSTLPVANQFAFCVFISARVLLIYWRYYSGSALASEFPALLNSLDEMSRLWSGFDSPTSLNLAGKYAETLRHLHQKSIDNEFFRINPSGYTTEISHAVSSAPTIEPSRLNRAREQNGHGKARMTNQHGELRTMLSVPGTSGGNSEISEMESNSTEAYHQGVPHGDLSTISQMFSDQNFIDVDRIISFNDGMFDAGYGGPGWS
ncbi:fungal-specific transcription factor domain-containing protein [Dactylonectria macrodidyma]|uniref:Fungal-specific transcription factor domain-containing protein n=1 Tax=Dactylonectria macrodidyma TaxID=307937 RepID=A0A9P9JKM8_9HYPO|nr:fungal-specific transcription factor domain-containing protein [Dactylonectria macrodidyma]